MKKHKKLRKKKPNTMRKVRRFIAVLLLVIGVIVVSFLILKHFDRLNSQKTNTDDTPVNTAKTITTTTEDEEGPTTTDKTPIQNEGVIVANEITGTITFAEYDTNYGQLTIRTTIDQRIGNNGTCELTLTSGDKVYTETTPVMNNPSSSTCQGFDVTGDKLSQGTWHINIKVTTGDKAGIIEGDVTI